MVILLEYMFLRAIDSLLLPYGQPNGRSKGETSNTCDSQVVKKHSNSRSGTMARQPCCYQVCVLLRDMQARVCCATARPDQKSAVPNNQQLPELAQAPCRRSGAALWSRLLARFQCSLSSSRQNYLPNFGRSREGYDRYDFPVFSRIWASTVDFSRPRARFCSCAVVVDSFVFPGE